MRDVVVATWGRWDEAWQRLHFAAHFRPERVTILEVEHRPVGMLEVDDRAEERYVANLKLLPAVQGRGLGTAVLLEVLAAARRRGVPVRLQVLRVNGRARRWYERLGFAVTGETATHVRLEYVHTCALAPLDGGDIL
jgi:ribosomal protein S18 acetylase RimI-like enzyme